MPPKDKLKGANMIDRSEPYKGLRLARTVRLIPPRLAAVAVAAVVYGLLWWLVPTSGLFWLLLATVVCLVWVASFGWRPAVSALVAFLRRLEGL
jgi:hypothetical protein